MNSSGGLDWAITFWRWFFPLFIPLTILLLLALQRRVSEYGFTELRYMGFILAAWLLAVSFYYSVRPTQSFKFIPWSLIGLLLLFSIGPVSPASVAFKSQWNRLTMILEQEGLLSNGTLVSNPHEVESERYKDLRSVFRYLRRGYGIEAFKPLISRMKPSDRTVKEGKDWSELTHFEFEQALLEFTGLKPKADQENKQYIVTVEATSPTPVNAKSKIYDFSSDSGMDYNLGDLHIQGKTVQVLKEGASTSIQFKDVSGGELAQFDFFPWLEKQNFYGGSIDSLKSHTLLPNELTFKVELKSLGVIKLVARRLEFHEWEDSWSLTKAELWILVPGD